MTTNQPSDATVVHNGLYLLLRLVTASSPRLLVRGDILDILLHFRRANPEHPFLEHPLFLRLQQAQVGAVTSNILFLGLREKPGKWNYLRLTSPEATVSEINAREFLAGEALAVGVSSPCLFHLQLEPFFQADSQTEKSCTLSNLAKSLERNKEKGIQYILDFLVQHQIGGQNLLLNKRVKTPKGLLKSIERALTLLKVQEDDTSWKRISRSMQLIGLEAGWGENIAEMRTRITLLETILLQPSVAKIRRFLEKIPCVSNLALIAPEITVEPNSLKLSGPKKTIRYLQEQVIALEKELEQKLAQSGINLTPRVILLCTATREETFFLPGSKHVQVIGIPAPLSIQNDCANWEQLEKFSRRGETAFRQIGFIPDAVIGLNASGGMAASFLARNMNCPLTCQSFSLQKNQGLFTAQYWQQHPDKYKTARNLLAELITLNRADLIFTISPQQALGDEKSVGQYEMYKTFILPGLVQVENGLDLSSDRFCPAAPGIKKTTFFPCQNTQDRLTELQTEIQELLFATNSAFAQGVFYKEKPILLCHTDLTPSSDPQAILRWAANDSELRTSANILLLSSPPKTDAEKQQAAGIQHHLLSFPKGVRWLQVDLDDTQLGELYRMVADTNGAFVSPTRFEGYSMHTLNALACGLPVFVSIYSHGKDLVEHGCNGFHIDPVREEECAHTLGQFFSICEHDRSLWKTLSLKASELASKQADWQTHARQVLTGLHQAVFCGRSVTHTALHAYLDLLFEVLREKLPYPQEQQG